MFETDYQLTPQRLNEIISAIISANPQITIEEARKVIDVLSNLPSTKKFPNLFLEISRTTEEDVRRKDVRIPRWFKVCVTN